MPEPLTPRPEVTAFAQAMEAQLRANDHKGGWQDCAPSYLLGRVYGELLELTACSGARAGAVPDPAHVIHEAADVANFAMMVADVCGGLDATPAPAPTAPEDKPRPCAECFGTHKDRWGETCIACHGEGGPPDLESAARWARDVLRIHLCRDEGRMSLDGSDLTRCCDALEMVLGTPDDDLHLENAADLAAQPRDWKQMTDAERGIIRCGKCGLGMGAEHCDGDNPEHYTCPECSPAAWPQRATDPELQALQAAFRALHDRSDLESSVGMDAEIAATNVSDAVAQEIKRRQQARYTFGFDAGADARGTAPAQPAPDEGAVEALARVLETTMLAVIANARSVVPTEGEYRAMGRAAIAWAHARYGGEAAALTAALEGFVGQNSDSDSCLTCGIEAGGRCEPPCTYAPLRSALALTPSAAGEAVTALVEAVDTLLTCRADMGKDIPGWGGRLDDAYVGLHDAAAPFLAARGGGRGA